MIKTPSNKKLLPSLRPGTASQSHGDMKQFLKNKDTPNLRNNNKGTLSRTKMNFHPLDGKNPTVS